jgi:uncharacterized protein YndB with AHSA1/START domain
VSADAYACAYSIYLHSTPEEVWEALTDPGRTAVYWAHHNVSDWRAGSVWEHRRADGSGIADIAGTVLEGRAPSRLVLTWANPRDATPVAGVAAPPRGGRRREPSRVTFDLEPHRALVRLTVMHENLASPAERDALTAGWAAILSNLKTYLETGQPLPDPPWEALPGFVRR